MEGSLYRGGEDECVIRGCANLTTICKIQAIAR
jgi:hypothetical protein